MRKRTFRGKISGAVLCFFTLSLFLLFFNTARTDAPFTSPPQVIDAVFSDFNDNGKVEEGETITLIMSQSVTINAGMLSPSSFYLPVTDDSLGEAGFFVELNPYNTRQIILALGAGASLTIPGVFSPSEIEIYAPSGIDIAAEFPPEAIQSLYGIPAVDGGVAGIDDSGVDILFALITNSDTFGSDGGTLTVTDSLEAAYTQHSITIPPGALSGLSTSSPNQNGPVAQAGDVTFTLQPPVNNYGVIGAMQIVMSDPNVTFSPPATLSLEYRESDVDDEMGYSESVMRIHQLVENPSGVFNWLQVDGVHTVNTTSNTVSVELPDPNPMGSIGTPRILANLPGETIEEKTMYIKKQTGGGGTAVISSSNPVIKGDSKSIYNLTQIEVPGYIETNNTDPQRISVTIKKPTLAQRVSTTGGNSFPTKSSALFVIETKNASGNWIAFTDPVNMRVQFLDGTSEGQSAFNDLLNFAGQKRDKWRMRIVKDEEDGANVDFQFVEGLSQTVTELSGGGTVSSNSVANISGTSGKGVWGAVARDTFPQTDTRNWENYK